MCRTFSWWGKSCMECINDTAVWYGSRHTNPEIRKTELRRISYPVQCSIYYELCCGCATCMNQVPIALLDMSSLFDLSGDTLWRFAELQFETKKLWYSMWPPVSRVLINTSECDSRCSPIDPANNQTNHTSSQCDTSCTQYSSLARRNAYGWTRENSHLGGALTSHFG